VTVTLSYWRTTPARKTDNALTKKRLDRLFDRAPDFLQHYGITPDMFHRDHQNHKLITKAIKIKLE
jgi:hypothetical protein